MRKMSFNKTIDQILDRSKTVTRRLGWKNLKPGTLLEAVDRVQFVKPQDQRFLALIRVTRVNREHLGAMLEDGYQREPAKEGFPQMLPSEFVEMFCKAFGCTQDTDVARIEFEYVEE